VAVLNCWVTDTRPPGGLEGLHEAGEVAERAAEAVDALDDDAVDLPAAMSPGVAAGRSVGVAAGEAAVVVALGEADPARVSVGWR